MDTSRVAELWRRFYPERYWVDESLIEFNCLGATVVVDGEAFAIAKPGEADVVHLSAIGAPSFDDFRRVIDGLFFCARCVFGCDRRHFFPGVPTECEELAGWLVEVGFVAGGSVYDMERDLVGYEPPVAPSTLVRRCSGSDRTRLSELLSSEFSPRWHDDCLEKFGEDPSRLFVLEIAGEVEGFAMTQMDGDAHRRAGAVWSRSLGPNWAALGPIGVSKRMRGQGHGDALLAAALCSLRDQGARRTIIDWTTLTGFYARHGFEVSREYVSYSRNG